jgi:hypothetical protein
LLHTRATVPEIPQQGHAETPRQLLRRVLRHNVNDTLASGGKEALPDLNRQIDGFVRGRGGHENERRKPGYRRVLITHKNITKGAKSFAARAQPREVLRSNPNAHRTKRERTNHSA